MKHTRSRVPLLLVGLLLSAPELGDCGNCTLPRERDEPAWVETDSIGVDAGFSGGRTQTGAHVTVVVEQPAGESFDVTLLMRVFTPNVVTPTCEWSSWNLCFAGTTRPAPQTEPPQPVGDDLSCPAVTQPIDGVHFNSFVSVSSSAPATVSCDVPYGCTLDGVTACKLRMLTLVRNTGGTDFTCSDGTCTMSLDVTLSLDQPGTPKLRWATTADAGRELQALRDEELVGALNLQARIDGPIVRLPLCLGCTLPRKPEGLRLRLEATPR